VALFLFIRFLSSFFSLNTGTYIASFDTMENKEPTTNVPLINLT